MSLLHAVLLGAVQGLTEFLPISSDGHLVVSAILFPVALEGRDALGFDVLLHAASLLALLLLYAEVWMRLLRSPFNGNSRDQRLLLLLMLSVVPGAIAGLLLEDVVALRLRTLTAAGLGFLCTAFVLILGERIGRWHPAHGGETPLTARKMLLLGVAQAVAILPGISRSGLTISAGRMMGLTRRHAVDVSFLMAVPIIAGAVAKILFDALQGSIVFPRWDIALAGFVSTFIVSVLAIVVLRRAVQHYSLAWFVWYLIPLSFFLLYHFSGVRQWLQWDALSLLVQRHGIPIVFLFSFLDVLPPLNIVSPAIFVLMIAGSLLASPASAFPIIMAALAGVSLGNILLFRLGFFHGPAVGHFFHLSDARLQRIEIFMTRFRRINVFFGQFIVLIRPGIAFVSGAARMPFLQYYPWMLLGSLLWATCYIMIGYLLNAHAQWTMPIIAVAGTVLYIMGLLTVALEVRVSRRRTRKTNV